MARSGLKAVGMNAVAAGQDRTSKDVYKRQGMVRESKGLKV